MKAREALSYLGIYSLVAASVIPSPIMNYAFNLLAFGSVVLLVLAVFMAIGSEEVIKTAVAKATERSEGSLEEERFRKGRKGLFAAYIPATIVMVIFGHWFVGSCLLITGVIMLGLFYEVVRKLKIDEKKQV